MASTPDPALIEQLRTALDSAYEIEREIGGGMSRVFVASERALARRVVIKVLPPELTAGVNRDRFRREIQFAARLQHPHIVPLLTAGQVGDILYYTMPFVEGETLRSRLDRQGRLSANDVISILQDVVDALAYAHAQGLIHRDIKPENIMLQRNHALVLDFGVAKALSEALPGTSATTVGVAVGTPAYMAPEQLAADPAADHRIDLYAVGLLAYELLSGSSPFAGSSPQRTLARQLTERPTPPHIQRTDVPPELSAIIMKCLEKEPTERFNSADDLLAALAKVRITLTGMRAVTRRMVLGSSPPRNHQRLAVVSGALLLLTALTVGAWGLWRRAQRAGAAPDVARIAVAPAAADAERSDTLHMAPAVAAPLTRADSEAIAAAVARRLTAHRPAPKPQPTISAEALDSIRSAVEHAVADSVMRMLASNRRGIRLDTMRFQAPGTPPGFPTLPGAALSGEAARAAASSGKSSVTIEMGGPSRVVVLDVVDVSRDRSLGELARTLTDSLARALRRRPNTSVLSGGRVNAAEQEVRSEAVLGMQLNADAVLRSSAYMTRDSVSLFTAIYDVREQRFAGTARRTVARGDEATLAASVAPLIGTWLDHRHTEPRSYRVMEGQTGVTMDSALRTAQRLRALMGRKPPDGRPDTTAIKIPVP